jgi:hypothetical protein
VTLEIFICYAREDEEQIKGIYRRLADSGFKPWMDTEDLLPGESWEHGIERAIQRADIFIACISSNSTKKRGFVQKEITRALEVLRGKLDGDIYIIPVRLDDCEVPESLKQLTWVDLFQETGWVRLDKSLKAVLKPRLETASTGEQKPSERGSAERHISETQLNWEVELQRILSGERSFVITRLGSVMDYVETTISLSGNPTESRLSFHDALRKLLQEQSPYKPVWNVHSAHLLDLINAYTPSNGCVWVLRLMKYRRSVNQGAAAAAQEQGPPRDLHLKALLALESYYPISPVGDDPIFNEYVRVLQHELLGAEYSGYAARRLLELDVLQPEDKDVRQLIRRTPGCLQELISFVLNPARRSRADRDLARLYSHCLIISEEAQREFEQALATAGVSLEHSNQGPLVIIDKGEMISLNLPEEAAYEYITARWNADAKRGIEKLAAMMSTAL